MHVTVEVKEVKTKPERHQLKMRLKHVSKIIDCTLGKSMQWMYFVLMDVFCVYNIVWSES